MTKRPDGRLNIAGIGEWYTDLLRIDSWINGRTMSHQASSLLCSKLYQREETIKQRVEYLARKRGMTTDELWFQILKGDAEEMSPDDIPETFPGEISTDS